MRVAWVLMAILAVGCAVGGDRSGLDTFNAADDACRHHKPDGRQWTPAYSACMEARQGEYLARHDAAADNARLARSLILMQAGAAMLQSAQPAYVAPPAPVTTNCFRNGDFVTCQSY